MSNDFNAHDFDPVRPPARRHARKRLVGSTPAPIQTGRRLPPHPRATIGGHADVRYCPTCGAKRPACRC